MATKKPASSKRRKGVTQPGNMTIPALAQGAGVSTTTIEKYIKRGCPRTSVEAVLKWRLENIRAVAEDCDPGEIGIELRRAEMVERWENARTRQLKNDVLTGKLIRKDEVELALRTALSRLMNRLQSLGLKCANVCPSELKATVKESVEDTVRVALKELTDDLENAL